MLVNANKIQRGATPRRFATTADLQAEDGYLNLAGHVIWDDEVDQGYFVKSSTDGTYANTVLEPISSINFALPPTRVLLGEEVGTVSNGSVVASSEQWGQLKGLGYERVLIEFLSSVPTAPLRLPWVTTTDEWAEDNRSGNVFLNASGIFLQFRDMDPTGNTVTVESTPGSAAFTNGTVRIYGYRETAPGVSSRIGEVFFRSSLAPLNVQGVLAVNPGTYPGLAAANPLWSAMYPQFVVGADIVFPPDVAGIFLRNIGGTAAAEGTYQAPEVGPHTHTYIDRSRNNNFTGRGNGSNVAHSGTASNDTRTTNANAGGDNYPGNLGLQLWTILDNYEVAVGAAGGSTTSDGTLSGLTDTDVGGVQDCQALLWDAAAARWAPSPGVPQLHMGEFADFAAASATPNLKPGMRFWIEDIANPGAGPAGAFQSIISIAAGVPRWSGPYGFVLDVLAQMSDPGQMNTNDQMNV